MMVRTRLEKLDEALRASSPSIRQSRIDATWEAYTRD